MSGHSQEEKEWIMANWGPKKPRTRKPKVFKSRTMTGGGYGAIYGQCFVTICYPSITDMTPKEARKLAAWLIKAANYLESKK